MRVHFIAIGGSIMHNLALALQQSGHNVTGSDDEIYEPSRSRLAAAGLLPDIEGWDPQRITPELDAVILGMHARKDNPELNQAIELGIKVYSFPEFVGGLSRDKTRVVIAGSHGKTSTTSMIMHALQCCQVEFDYLVGAQLPDFELMVKLSDAPVIIIEGDEYLSSPLDRRPKFLHYTPQITCITGVAWDHMNVFPTEEIYHSQFSDYLNSLPQGAQCFLFDGDKTLHRIADLAREDLDIEYYAALDYTTEDGSTIVHSHTSGDYPMQVFGRHNLENMEVARRICNTLGVLEADFLNAMQSFTGAAMRLQLLETVNGVTAYRDFAHAPSKVRATVNAVREKHLDAEIVAICELHTFSSLSKNFLPQYSGALDAADRRIVFFSPHTLEMKKLPALTTDDITGYFGDGIEVCVDKEELKNLVSEGNGRVHLWMSSGRFGGLDINALYSTPE